MDPIDQHLKGYIEGLLDDCCMKTYSLEYTDNKQFELELFGQNSLLSIKVFISKLEEKLTLWNNECYFEKGKFYIK